MLVDGIEQLEIDLLAPMTSSSKIESVCTAIELSTSKFKDQVEKAGLGMSSIREARLRITKEPGSRKGWVNDHPCTGHDLVVEVNLTSARRETLQNSK